MNNSLFLKPLRYLSNEKVGDRGYGGLVVDRVGIRDKPYGFGEFVGIGSFSSS